MSALVGGIVIIAIIILMVVVRGLQMKKLAHDGTVAKGKVIEKLRRSNTQGGMSSGYLRYEFTVANGETYRRKVAVGEEIFAKYELGDEIGVVYLPTRPEINAARYMVNLSREALKLPPL